MKLSTPRPSRWPHGNKNKWHTLCLASAVVLLACTLLFAGLFGWAFSGLACTSSSYLAIPTTLDGLVNPLPDLHCVSSALKHPRHCRDALTNDVTNDGSAKTFSGGLTQAITHLEGRNIANVEL